MGDVFATPRGQGDELVELLWCAGHAVMHSQEHEVAPWFQYPVIDDDNGGSLQEDLFSESFGQMPAASDTASHCAPPPPPRGVRANDATSYHDASPTRPRAPVGEKRKQRDTHESPSKAKAIQDAEVYDTAAMTTSTPARRATTGKRRRAAQVHNLSERVYLASTTCLPSSSFGEIFLPSP
uniref:Uncharacterized protein n=1 Tax=Avena sativa TaxID=4498 RepID=A0ACD5ZY95_AVESA